MLTGNLRFNAETTALLRKAHLQPQPRIPEGQLLVKQGVRAAIDISDGLVADLGHVCAASKVRATVRVNAVPIHPQMQEAFGKDALDMTLTGGEDYELLFMAGEQIIEKVRAAIGADCPVTVIGEITGGTGVVLLGGDGKPYHINGLGWDHFQKGG